jgi:hypothetical protein
MVNLNQMDEFFMYFTMGFIMNLACFICCAICIIVIFFVYKISMNDNEINDARNANEFKSISFSKYKKTAVTKELLNCLVNSRIEAACNWSAELICAGHYADLWEIILTYLGKHIHLGNPKLPIYIDMRFNKFKDILMNGYLDNELSMRNNDKIRKLFAEIICTLCHSKKKHSFERIKIKKTEEFDITQMTSRLKAPNVTYASECFLKDDPKELFIAINEFAYHISSESKNIVSACYWIEWIIEFESICKSKKEKCICERRTFPPVADTHQNDVIWIIWDVILTACRKTINLIRLKIMNALLNVFCIKFSAGTKKRRRFLIYFAVSLLTETIDYTTEMISNKVEIDATISKINVIYKQIKKNEISPQTDYLFNGISNRSNLDKTIQKLETMGKMMNAQSKSFVNVSLSDDDSE